MITVNFIGLFVQIFHVEIGEFGGVSRLHGTPVESLTVGLERVHKPLEIRCFQ